MGKRAERRKRGIVPFGQIVYYYEVYSTPFIRKEMGLSAHERPAGGRLRYFKRDFPTYEDAVAHLVEVQLGYIEEKWPTWPQRYKHRGAKPCRLVEGYIRKGRKVITRTKVLAKPEIKYERFGVRRDEFSERLFRKQWNRGLPFYKSMEGAWTDLLKPREATATVTVRSNRPSRFRFRPERMVRRVARPKYIPKPRPVQSWRTTSSCIRSPRAAALQQFSNSALARSQQNRYR